MKEKNQLWTPEARFLTLCALLLAVFLIVKLPGVVSWGPGPNNFNYSVRTIVNITNSFPEIINITCNEGDDIVLTAGTSDNMTCIIEIRDFDGGSTINLTNMTFFNGTADANDADDNNSHYTNSSCTQLNAAGFFANYSCRVDVMYFATNGTWNVNITVTDDVNASRSNVSLINISPLYAVNVTELIDYGQMAVGDTSAASEIANVTNFGNVPINVSVYGFGGNTTGAGGTLAMNCTQRNISIPNQHYSINSSESSYFTMEEITNTAATIASLTIPKQTVNENYIVNTTYWRLHINTSDNPAGQCNGTVVFSAVVP